MISKSNTQIMVSKVILGFAGAVLVVGSVFTTPLSYAKGISSETRYVVKLFNPDPSILYPLASNVEQEFGFARASEFAGVYSFESSIALKDLRTKLEGSFEYLEYDVEYLVKDTIVKPNDPGFTDDEFDIKDQWGLPKAKFPEAWTVTKGSSANVVAIIDTGIDATHKDLRKRTFKPGYDFVNNTEIKGRVNSDDNGHGTLVAGVIGAIPNNDTGIAGTNWQVSFMPLKALNTRGSGKASNVAEAIVWAADHNATIINMSLGGSGFGHDTVLTNAISYAFNKNVIIVAAAGNDAATNGGNLDVEPVFPICGDNGRNMIIGVTATDQNDTKPAFANYGKSCIDVTAPGRRILSTINHDPHSGAMAKNSYAYASGTSLATPFVSGLAALLKSRYPNATNSQIRDAIISSADKVDDLNLTQCAGFSCKGVLGTGRINAYKSLTSGMSFVSVEEGDVVRVEGSTQNYYISGGQKHLISPFVQAQRFADVSPKVVSESYLRNYPEGNYATPREGTLVKIDRAPTIYYISKGLRLPVTYQVFQMRNFKFANVHTLSYDEVNSWLVGSYLSPPNGTLVRTAKNPTVYWVVDGVMHPINYEFYLNRGLQSFPTVYVADQDIKNFSIGEPYIR